MKKIMLFLIAVLLIGTITGCNQQSETEKTASIEHFEGTIIAKEDYAVVSPKNNHEVFFLTVQDDTGTTHKIRVTSVTFQQYNEGDTFDTHGHICAGSIVE